MKQAIERASCFVAAVGSGMCLVGLCMLAYEKDVEAKRILIGGVALICVSLIGDFLASMCKN